MKFLLSALALGLAVTAAASQAEAAACSSAHHGHCAYHKHMAYHHHHHWRYGDDEGAGPRVAVYPPYTYYYPPTPATIFDVPPEDRLPANQLQWQINQMGDRPYAQDTPY